VVAEVLIGGVVVPGVSAAIVRIVGSCQDPPAPDACSCRDDSLVEWIPFLRQFWRAHFVGEDWKVERKPRERYGERFRRRAVQRMSDFTECSR